MSNLDVKSNEERVIEFQVLAEQGDARAQYLLGMSYETGYGGVVKSLEQAKILYEKSAVQGYVRAQSALGVLLAKSDFKTAYMWLYVAKANGIAEEDSKNHAKFIKLFNMLPKIIKPEDILEAQRKGFIYINLPDDPSNHWSADCL